MADYEVAADEQGVKEKTLAAGGDTVTIAGEGRSHVEVLNVDGTSSITFTVDGTAVVVNGNVGYYIPAAAGAFVKVEAPGGDEIVVTLDSPGTPVYCVTAA